MQISPNGKKTPRASLFVILFSSLSFLLSCTPSQSTSLDMFRNHFVPPAPRPAEPTDAPQPANLEPPALAPNAFLNDAPNFILAEPRVPPRPQLDVRIRRSEEHFQAGRRFYQDGDLSGARKEFDKAVDLLLASAENAPDRLVMERKFEDMVDRIHRLDLDGLGAGNLEQNPIYDRSPLQEILELTFPVDPKIKSRVSDELLATTSQLPLESNDEVLRYINYFSSDRGRKTLIAGLRRAGRYAPMIRRILAEEGVPQELIFLAQAESGFLPRAVSYMAAVGMWQFIAERGRQYGLYQTPYTDDRLDPEKATRAAARHLKDLFQQFGDWYLAMAAYNCGPFAVDKAVQRTGYADFWEIRKRNALPRETSNYVPLILAMTIMAKNARDYDLEDVTPDAPEMYDTVRVSALTNLALVADLSDRPLPELQAMNPSLLKNLAPAGYGLRVPQGVAVTLEANLTRVPEDKRAFWRAHRAAEGDTLASIARRYGTTVPMLSSANHSIEAVQPGEVVIVPAVQRTVHTAPVRLARRTAPVSNRARSTAARPASPGKAASAAKTPAKAPAAKASATKSTPAKAPVRTASASAPRKVYAVAKR